MKLLTSDQKTTLLETIRMRKDGVQSVVYSSDYIIELKHELQDLWDYVKEFPTVENQDGITPNHETVKEVNFAVMEKIGEIEKLQERLVYSDKSSQIAKAYSITLRNLRRGSRWLMEIMTEVSEEFVV